MQDDINLHKSGAGRQIYINPTARLAANLAASPPRLVRCCRYDLTLLVKHDNPNQVKCPTCQRTLSDYDQLYLSPSTREVLVIQQRTLAKWDGTVQDEPPKVKEKF